MTNTVIQPTIRNQGERVKEPITLGLFVSFIMTATIGAAMISLMIALQLRHHDLPLQSHGDAGGDN